MRRFFSARGAILLVGLSLSLVYLWIAAARISYPFGLDLVEEGMLMQAWRVAKHHPVFLPPNAEFVPQVYMPLYTWLSGALLKITGFAFWPLRLISFGSTMISAAIIFVVGRRESQDPWVAAMGAFLFLSGYRLVGGWYDLARVDTLFLALALAGMATAAYVHHSRRGMMMTGLLLGLALLTKQNGLLLAILVGVYLWQAARRRWLFYILSFMFTVATPLLYLQISTQGWFSYYVIDIAYASPVDIRRLWHMLGSEILAGMGILSLLGAIALVADLRKERLSTPWASPWLMFVGAGVFISLAGRASVGGNLNNLIMGYGSLCLTPALLTKSVGKRGWSTHLWRRRLLYAGVLCQLVLNQFQPFTGRTMTAIPSPQMKAAGQALVQQLKGVEGEVLVMMHPSYSLFAGKEPGVHIQSLWHARHRGEDPLPPEFVERIVERQYALIVSDDSPFFEQDPALVSLLEQHYRLDRTLSEFETPPTLSGLVIRPRLIYVPNEGQ